MKYFVGTDIGSTFIKIAVIDENEKLIGHNTVFTGSHFHENTVKAVGELLGRLKISQDDVEYTVSTGYGRKLLKEADETVSEITANVTGVRNLSGDNGKIKTIINIGGQDLKIISLDDNGNCKNFAMNDKCAAGTGRFLEMVAKNMEVDVSELGNMHINASGLPVSVNSTCTVFAESEIISLLANGHGRNEVVAGVHFSIAKRIARLAQRVGVEDVIFFDGGPALNRGLVLAIEDELMRDIFIPDTPQITTAFGAALIAKDSSVLEKETVDA